MSYVARIDESACIAQGDCQELAPEAFAVGDAAVFLGGGTDELILEAARTCPTGAIIVVDQATDEQVFP